MQQLISAICTIVGGLIVGIVTYWFSSKLWPASIKKNAMTHTLEHALSPILKIVRPVKNLSISDMISDINSIDKIMKDNPFDIPPLHRYKIDDINRFIELYEDDKTSVESKQILKKKIKIEYSSYVSMFNIQCNYVRKQLGYPYSNFYDSLRYETGSPFMATLFLLLILVIWAALYVLFLIENKYNTAMLILLVPTILYAILAILYRVLKNHGGIIVVINNIKCKNEDSSQTVNDRKGNK